MGTARMLPGQALLPSGRVLVVGGDAAGTTGEVYDPVANSWTPIANAMASPHLASPLVFSLPGGTVHTPATVPAAPASVSAVAGNGRAIVIWSPTSSNGGRPIVHVDLFASASRAKIARSFNLTLASKSYGLATKRKIKLKPSKKLVGKARKFTVRPRIRATDGAGNSRTVTKTIRVSR